MSALGYTLYMAAWERAHWSASLVENWSDVAAGLDAGAASIARQPRTARAVGDRPQVPRPLYQRHDAALQRHHRRIDGDDLFDAPAAKALANLDYRQVFRQHSARQSRPRRLPSRRASASSTRCTAALYGHRQAPIKQDRIAARDRHHAAAVVTWAVEHTNMADDVVMPIGFCQEMLFSEGSP